MAFLVASGVAQTAINSTGGAVHDILVRNGPRTAYAQCALMTALIPNKAEYVGYRISNVDIDTGINEPSRNGGCIPGQDCTNGWSRFMTIPDVRENAGARAVWTVFANWSDRRRGGQLIVFYKMPQGANVPHPM
jgi:hypothetical protein